MLVCSLQVFDVERKLVVVRATIAAVVSSSLRCVCAGCSPMYSSSSGFSIAPGMNEDRYDSHIRASLQPLFVKYKVNMALYGRK
jgi:predicted histidine transporter YuiF (NhaC family)